MPVLHALSLLLVAAQSFDDPLGEGGPTEGYFLDLGAPTAQSFEDAVVADLTGDGLADFVTRRGNVLDMMFAPALFESRISAFWTGNDLDVLPGPTTDALIVVGAAGLERLDWVVESPFFQATALGSAAWNGAKRVVVHAPEGTTPEIYGLMSDRRTFRRVIGSSPPVVEQQLFQTGTSVEDFVVFDYDGVGAPELGVMTATGLEVYDSSGNRLVNTDGYLVTSLAIATVRQSPTSPEWLLWFIVGPGGVNEYLVSCGQEGLVVQENFESLPGVVACDSGDVDGDGDDDLLISYTGNQAVGILYNLGDEAPEFTIDVPQAVKLLHYGPPATPAPTNRARPVWSDLDTDGDLDVAFAVQEPARLFVHKNNLVDHDALAPSLYVDESLSVGERPPLLREGENGELELVLDVFVSSVPTEAAFVELAMWRKEAPSIPTDPEGYPTVEVAVADAVPHELGSIFHMTLPIPESAVPFDFTAIYFWGQRFVSSSGVVVSPALAYGIAVQGTASETYLLGLSTTGEGWDVPLFRDFLDDEMATIAPLACIPDLDEDNPPRPRED